MTFNFLAVEENSLKFVVNFEYYTFKYFLRLGLLKHVCCVCQLTVGNTDTADEYSIDEWNIFFFYGLFHFMHFSIWIFL